ncbi:hypothetical protein SB861_51465 [Paraburkholderia sp. SIMBA_049]
MDAGIVLRVEGKVIGCREDSERNNNLVNFEANADDFRKNPTQYVCAICNSPCFAGAIAWQIVFDGLRLLLAF